MPSADAVRDAIATALRDGLCGTAALIPRLQVTAGMVDNPSPPSIDIYPADPFTEAISYGRGQRTMRWTILARVLAADQDAGQDLLLSMMDPTSNTSVSATLEDDSDLGGTVGGLVVTGPSGMAWADAEHSLIGCTWTAEVTP